MATVTTAAASPDDNKKPVRLALNLIKADKKALQPRVEMDDDHMQRMARSYIEGEDIPPPVHVFWDGKFNWLVDGFHRYFAMWSIRHMGAKFTHIRAIVHQGTKQDAIAYAATANLDNRSKSMNDADRKKAMWMLLDLNQWSGKSSTTLARLFGLSASTGKKYYVEYFSCKNIPIPKFAESSNGRLMPCNKRSPKKGDTPRISKVSPKKHSGHEFRATIDDKSIYLGSTTLEDATRKLNDIISENQYSKAIYRKGPGIAEYMSRRQFHTNRAFSDPDSLILPGIWAKRVGDIFFTWDSFPERSSAVNAIGRAICIREKTGAAKVVILCPVDDGPPGILELGRKAGIEFMTIEDFVASLQAKGESTPEE